MDLWNHREHPGVLAAIRIGVALCVLWDFLTIWRLDLVVELLGAEEIGGLNKVIGRSTPNLYHLVEPVEPWAWILWAAVIVAGLLVASGLFSRVSCVFLMLAYSQAEMVSPMSDRAIDMLLRNVLLILAFSASGSALSLDALWKGNFWGKGIRIPAWPRHLLVVQLVIMYFTAGVQKVGVDWMPMGHFSALYKILHDPAIATYRYGWVESLYPLTQLGTAVTMVWEWTTPLLLLHFFYRATRERKGTFRKWMLKADFRLLWVLIGVIFHLGIAGTMSLGIFPYAMLVLYLCFFHPDEFVTAWKWTRVRIANLLGL